MRYHSKRKEGKEMYTNEEKEKILKFLQKTASKNPFVKEIIKKE
jgi:hypothetical protein